MWLVQHAEGLNGDPTRIVVGGDSAGGNLSAALTIRARDKGGPKFLAQLLLYPVTNTYSLDTSSYHDYAEGYGLTKGDMEWFCNHYLEQREDGTAPYASPLLCDDLGGLPPAHIITAEFDVLRDEAEAYARRLKEAGNDVTCVRYNGMIHGFLTMDGILDKANGSLTELANVLRSMFQKG
jgi:acetyl esterase